MFAYCVIPFTARYRPVDVVWTKLVDWADYAHWMPQVATSKVVTADDTDFCIGRIEYAPVARVARSAITPTLTRSG